MRKFSKVVEEWDDDGWGEGVNFNDNVDSEIQHTPKIKSLKIFL